MRLWSFSPEYLDPVGLSRAINEGIAGYKALTKQQKMWQNHPQLNRFRVSGYGSELLTKYLKFIMEYQYHKRLSQINECYNSERQLRIHYSSKDLMTVTDGQLIYEWNHYLDKLKKRNTKKHAELREILIPRQHPIFKVVKGNIEDWEKVK